MHGTKTGLAYATGRYVLVYVLLLSDFPQPQEGLHDTAKHVATVTTRRVGHNDGCWRDFTSSGDGVADAARLSRRFHHRKLSSRDVYMSNELLRMQR